jgi:hypothetical protein
VAAEVPALPAEAVAAHATMKKETRK